MIQILTLIRLAFPFLLLTAFFCLYRKEYGFMKRFMWKMAMFQSARNLYAYLVVLMLIFINWCCHVTTPNLSVIVSTLLTLVLLNRKIAGSTFHLLHERKRLWFATLLLSMVCYALPYMNSMFLFLFTVSVAAVFYPSERVLQLKSHPEAINNLKDLLALIIRNYYYVPPATGT